MKQHILLSLAFGLMVALTMPSCGSSKADSHTESVLPKGAAPIPVRLAEIGRVNAQRPVHIGGLLATEDEARLSFKTGGIIQRVYVKAGDPVKPGQLLATLDMTEISAQVKQAQLGFEKAKRDFDRVTILHRDSVATLEMLQNAQTGLDLATQTLEAARFNATHSEIRANAGGFVLARLMNEGEMAGPGMPVLALSTTSGKSQWVLRAGVADREWSLLNVGDSAAVLLDAYPGTVFQAKLSRKSQGADPYSGAFQIEVEVEGAKEFAVGMFGEATIYPKTQAEYWLLPYEAVLEADGEEAFVFVTKDRKTAQRVPVKVAYLEQDKVAISAGLEGYTEVVTGGSAYLSDNSPIVLAK